MSPLRTRAEGEGEEELLCDVEKRHRYCMNKTYYRHGGKCLIPIWVSPLRKKYVPAMERMSLQRQWSTFKAGAFKGVYADSEGIPSANL